MTSRAAGVNLPTRRTRWAQMKLYGIDTSGTVPRGRCRSSGLKFKDSQNEYVYQPVCLFPHFGCLRSSRAPKSKEAHLARSRQLRRHRPGLMAPVIRCRVSGGDSVLPGHCRYLPAPKPQQRYQHSPPNGPTQLAPHQLRPQQSPLLSSPLESLSYRSPAWIFFSSTFCCVRQLL